MKRLFQIIDRPFQAVRERAAVHRRLKGVSISGRMAFGIVSLERAFAQRGGGPEPWTEQLFALLWQFTSAEWLDQWQGQILDHRYWTKPKPALPAPNKPLWKLGL